MVISTAQNSFDFDVQSVDSLLLVLLVLHPGNHRLIYTLFSSKCSAVLMVTVRSVIPFESVFVHGIL